MRVQRTCSTHLNIRKIRGLAKINSGLSTKIVFAMVFSDKDAFMNSFQKGLLNKDVIVVLPCEPEIIIFFFKETIRGNIFYTSKFSCKIYS